jgi:hypothetical protein
MCIYDFCVFASLRSWESIHLLDLSMLMMVIASKIWLLGSLVLGAWQCQVQGLCAIGGSLRSIVAVK